MSISFTEAVDSFIDADRALISTAIPAKVLNYDPVTQNAVVQPLINNLLKDERVIPYPRLEDVPVIFPSTSKSMFTFPIEINDTVLLIFSQRSLDKWLSTQDTNSVNPDDFRKHDYSDAIAIPGLSSFPRAINNPKKHKLTHSTDDAVISHNIGTDQENEIRLTKNGSIKISAGATTKLTINLDGTVVIDAPTSLEINAPTTNWNGNINHTGDLTSSGTITGTTDVIGGGKSVKLHTHIGSPTAPSGSISNTGLPI